MKCKVDKQHAIGCQYDNQLIDRNCRLSIGSNPTGLMSLALPKLKIEQAFNILNFLQFLGYLYLRPITYKKRLSQAVALAISCNWFAKQNTL